MMGLVKSWTEINLNKKFVGRYLDGTKFCLITKLQKRDEANKVTNVLGNIF